MLSCDTWQQFIRSARVLVIYSNNKPPYISYISVGSQKKATVTCIKMAHELKSLVENIVYPFNSYVYPTTENVGRCKSIMKSNSI